MTKKDDERFEKIQQAMTTLNHNSDSMVGYAEALQGHTQTLKDAFLVHNEQTSTFIKEHGKQMDRMWYVSVAVMVFLVAIAVKLGINITVPAFP